jgi:hypothetical protein
VNFIRIKSSENGLVKSNNKISFYIITNYRENKSDDEVEPKKKEEGIEAKDKTDEEL